jgi:hypothetical protein
MRETCARALAAALMTGAIATALGLPSAFESASAPERGLTAPPSSLQRTVRIPSGTVRERPHRAELLVVRSSSHPSATTKARDVRRVSVHRHPPVTQQPRVASTRGPAPKPASPPAPSEPPVAAPAPAPVPAGGPRELTSTTPDPPPAVEAEAPPRPVAEDSETDKEHGNKDKDKEKKDKEEGRGHSKED